MRSTMRNFLELRRKRNIPECISQTGIFKAYIYTILSVYLNPFYHILFLNKTPCVVAFLSMNLLGDDDSDTEVSFTISKDFAKRYDKWRQGEELEKRTYQIFQLTWLGYVFITY